ncbi:MAG TPA: hypothetical protein VJZ00_02670, partial [Thermoanaerobaculia bacterium]|nr:hypothetical protein [Thermoanaerobaculia bacterium]
MIAALVLSLSIDPYRVAVRQEAPIETIFNAATRIQSTLPRELEDLSDAEFLDLQHLLPGIVLNREEVLLAEPDADFFLALARRRGNDADIAFFEAYKRTFPESVWASYLEQETDVTGCIRFGSGELVARYADWRAYRAAYPNAYRDAVAARLSDIEEHVTEGTRSCSSRAEDTRRELRE